MKAIIISVLLLFKSLLSNAYILDIHVRVFLKRLFSSVYYKVL